MKKAALFILFALLATIEKGYPINCYPNGEGGWICSEDLNPQDKSKEKRDLSKPIDKMI